jgi:hypothetical protein
MMQQVQTPNGKLLGTIAEAVEFIGVNRIRLQEMVKAGELKNYGSSTRFKLAWREVLEHFGGEQ